jgi:hypothetical protein
LGVEPVSVLEIPDLERSGETARRNQAREGALDPDHQCELAVGGGLDRAEESFQSGDSSHGTVEPHDAELHAEVVLEERLLVGAVEQVAVRAARRRTARVLEDLRHRLLVRDGGGGLRDETTQEPIGLQPRARRAPGRVDGYPQLALAASGDVEHDKTRRTRPDGHGGQVASVRREAHVLEQRTVVRPPLDGLASIARNLDREDLDPLDPGVGTRGECRRVEAISREAEKGTGETLDRHVSLMVEEGELPRACVDARLGWPWRREQPHDRRGGLPIRAGSDRHDRRGGGRRAHRRRLLCRSPRGANEREEQPDQARGAEIHAQRMARSARSCPEAEEVGGTRPRCR